MPAKTGGWLEDVRLRWMLASSVGHAGATVTSVLLFVNLIRALLPTAVGLVTGVMINELLHGHRQWSVLAGLAVLTAGLVLLTQVVEIVATALKFTVAKRVDGWHRDRLTELAQRPSVIEPLERMSVQDDLNIALLRGLPGWVNYTFGSGAVGQVVMTTRTVGATGAAVVFGFFSWPLAIALMCLAVLVRGSINRDWMAQHSTVRQLAPATRRAQYWAEVATAPWAAKETKVFGLAVWATHRYRDALNDRTVTMDRIRRRLLSRLGIVFGLLVIAAIVGLSTVTLAAAGGRLSAGALAIYLTALWNVLAISRLDDESFDVQFAGLPTLRAVDRLHVELGSAAGGQTGRRLTLEAPPVIRFEAVGFSYPKGHSPVLRDFDLEIRPGELLAVVGVNGAGKTTFTKLLGALYTPTEGAITVNGMLLAEIDPQSWREQLTVVFQDFVRYELSIRDNIVLGAPGRDDEEELLEFIRDQAGISDLVARAPLGWQTPLAREYTGGIQLSGGQWQRIALARALYAVAAGARLLVLDEPTAHLDVRAEAELFERVSQQKRQASVLLISHRLSTVRHADRIVLIDGGRIRESGTHAELMAAGGDYAEMFAMQADRFGDVRLDSETARR